MSAQALSTTEIKARIQAKYGDGAIVLFEVRNSTGYGAERTADAVVVETWKSRGYAITGIEIKASRSDWLRELKNPAKAEPIHKFCDRWLLAVGHQSVVGPGELPAGWGLLVPYGAKLQTAVVPATLKPEPVDRGFLAALLRRARATGLDDPAVTAAIELVRKEAKEAAERDRTWQQRDHEKLQAKVAEFEAAAGFSIAEGWHGPKLTGETVRALMDARDRHEYSASEIHRLFTNAEKIANALRSVVADLGPSTNDVENAA